MLPNTAKCKVTTNIYPMLCQWLSTVTRDYANMSPIYIPALANISVPKAIFILDQDEKSSKCFGWKKIESLRDKNVIKISVGRENSVYLASDGFVHAGGQNLNAECGLGLDIADVNVPTVTEYFRKRGIKIVDIETAFDHSLALDVNGKVHP